jgi:unsaturated rhamnogalacturonyl hydrolase
MHRVNDYQLKNPWKETDRNWIRATYYTGVMAFYRATHDQKLLDQAIAWGDKHKWQVGTEGSGANKLTCCQTWLDLYMVLKKPEMLAPTVAWANSTEFPAPGFDGVWYTHAPRGKGHRYADSLYVGPPALVKLYKITGEKKYLEIMDTFYWDVYDEIYDKEARFFYRDKRFIEPRSVNGKKIFWSRGNGWVMGGLPRILEHLPKDHQTYPRYVALLKQMSEALAACQGEDGLWRPNLADAKEFPMPETSGTGFFVYAMAWGINNKILDRDTYLPVVQKAWTGLVRSVNAKGKVQWGQLVGDRPVSVKKQHSHEYVTATFLLAGSEMLKISKNGGRAKLAAYPYDKTRKINLSDTFKRLKAPGTGRLAIQLTSGDGFCYPLYYFIPSLTKDLKYLIYHRASGAGVQLYRLNLTTGESVQLTSANVEDSGWYPWDAPNPGRGVLDHRSALNVALNVVVYFTGKDGRQVRVVDVGTIDDQPLFELPEGREAIGQNCCTPDGEWFVYIHAPRGTRNTRPCKGAVLAAYNFRSKEHRILTTIDSPIHHVQPYGNDRFIFCHTPSGNGMMMATLEGDPWVILRDRDPGAKGRVCHHMTTSAGIAYEADGHISGLYDPDTKKRFEFLLPREWGYTHTGWDPEGRLWFWEAAHKHHLAYLKHFDENQKPIYEKLTDTWRTYGRGQKSHFHPQLTPDRNWILFVGGDETTKSNHIFLLDASGLKETKGVSREWLSKTGDLTLNSRTKPSRRQPYGRASR